MKRSIVRKIFGVSWRSVLTMVLLALLVTMLLSFSPIYDFSKNEPFSGPDIYNPYSSFDSSLGWKRANFHTHTKVPGLLNECKYWPCEVLKDYQRLGYDIVTFSNHNRLTFFPQDSCLRVNVYEHGYNLFKFHKLVFGSQSVWHYDHMLPFLASQRQWQIDRLSSQADFIQLNHPFRTWFTTRRIMESIGSYHIMELDSGVTIEQPYWDWALSSGHYSFGLANDDCHDSKRSSKIGVRCNFLNVANGNYEELRKCLLSGCYFSMRVPDFGNGDWDEKIERNKHLPSILSVNVNDDRIEICFSEKAQWIEAIGQDHRCLCKTTDSNQMEYILPHDEPYVRFTASFCSEVVIYTNVFARYDSKKSTTPYKESNHTLNLAWTIIYNFVIVSLAIVFLWMIFLLWRKNYNDSNCLKTH
ncbi:MAG: hypothetical protein KBS95_07590 [Alistipes sp.]|nr:hypothetical protein [Candidatus Alistipes equi]